MGSDEINHQKAASPGLRPANKETIEWTMVEEETVEERANRIPRIVTQAHISIPPLQSLSA